MAPFDEPLSQPTVPITWHMKVLFAVAELPVVLEALQAQIGADRQWHGYENLLRLPPALGKGQIRSINLRAGLDLYIQDHCLKESLCLNFSAVPFETARICLKFCLSGRLSGFMRGAHSEIVIPSGSHFLSYSDMAGTVELAGGHLLRTVEILIAPELIEGIMNGQPSHPGTLGHSLSRRNANSIHWCVNKTTPLMNITLHQIFHCAYSGALRRVYIESKVLELVALYFSQSHTLAGGQQPVPIKPDDIRRLHLAKDILTRQMHDPPSLIALARQVGINDHKLKQGFQ